MPSKGKKRPASPSPSKPTRKRARVVPSDKEVIVIDDDDDDLEAILAQIKESEESEKLAKRLQSVPGPSSSRHEIIDVDDDSDEALARRLQAEWGNEEAAPEPIDADAWNPHSTSNETRPLLHVTDDVSPDQKLTEFRPFFTTERPCTKCGKSVKTPRGFVVFSPVNSPNALPPSLAMLLHAPCNSCGTNHCRGCFSPLTCPKSCKGAHKNPKCTVETCCAGARALAVFECLGGFDRVFLAERATSDSRAMELAKQRGPSTSTVGPGGTGYGTGGHGHYSGGGGQGRGKGKGKGAGNAANLAQLADPWDEIVVRSLNTLTKILPSPYADAAAEYDLLPHPSIGYLVALSQMPELLGSLLRNDSVTDWTARSEVYYAMIALLRRMADCELTVQALIGERFCMQNSPGLEEWMWGNGELSWEKNKEGQLERVPPLYDHFKKLTKQGEAFLSGAQHLMENGDGDDMDETVQAVSLCGDIIAARDDMERAMSILGCGSGASDTTTKSNGKGKSKGRDPAADMEKKYTAACDSLAFEHIEMDYSQYNYQAQLKQTESSTRAPKDRLHLVKELATMATSLPPGIFVRVDEVRNDAIKIMIAGPDGTPYAGGLFEFDCFIPLTYPAGPPLVHLRTTGGGSVRFNPNLYNCGKVCLSLLGTWPGRPEEQWSASSSTLLQVLVSIQSMILIEAPYYNEPGHGKANSQATVSINYNREIEKQTCRWAITDWMSDKGKESCWKDVITAHFTIRKDSIRQSMLDWSAKNRDIRSYHQSGGQPHGNGRANKQKAAGTSLDLVAEFDEGIERIERWVK